MARMTGFELRWIWYLTSATIFVQLGAVLWLLQREFQRKLGPVVAPLPAPAPAP
jgi:hypothetical protein